MIYVCSLKRLQETIEGSGARHVVTLLADNAGLARPGAIAPENHLWLQLHDISEPQEGLVLPQSEHVEQLIAFVQRWPRDTALVVHCYAGVSRSSAAAFVAVCALNPACDERAIAAALRRASPTATPNLRIVTIADRLLERQGRMIRAVEAIGRGADLEDIEGALPFRLEISGH
jgi:predicted protein tyrosine phosphatase